MTDAALRRPAPGQLALGVVLVAATAGAWALTAGRMGTMNAGPGADLGGVGWFAVSWVVMMAAMMLPPLAPMLVAFERRAGRADSLATFAAGYFAAWLAAGLLAYALVEGVRSLGPDSLAWGDAGRYVAAAVIAGAGLYQVTSLKRACLRACRERALFIVERWRHGRIGALRMGLEHGGWVRRLQLGAHGGAVRARGDELDLDGAGHGPGGRRADATAAGADGRGCRPGGARAVGRARARRCAEACGPGLGPGVDGRCDADALALSSPPSELAPGPPDGETALLPLAEGPCPSCTALLDQLDGAAEHASQHINLVVVAKAPLPRVLAFARERGWRRLRLISSATNTYNADYLAETPEGVQRPMLTVFHRDQEAVRHFWSSELLYAPSDPGQEPRHVGTLEPLWNLFDLTPEGRPVDWVERFDYD